MGAVVGYVLGIDLGTTYSSAAINAGGRTEIVQLGSRSAVVPSLVVLKADGEILSGEAAERRALQEPSRAAREFKRRLGDPTPLLLGGTPYGAESVMGLLLAAIMEQVVREQGGPPELTCITHPASYGPYKQELLTQAVQQADIGPVFFLTEPEAAALHYAEQERVNPGTLIAVYDFGGGTFDAAVLRKTDSGFELLGEPQGMERLGGIDFDESVFQHVRQALGNSLDELKPGDPSAQAAVSRLREESRQAKEALSTDTETVIPVLLPNVQTDVRLTRAEFEAAITPRIRETVAALERSVRSAGITMNDVDRVLLVGGTSRIPLIGALVREITGRPVAVDAHPKHTVALGAAAEARRRLEAGEQPGRFETAPAGGISKPAPSAAPVPVAVEMAPAAAAASAPPGWTTGTDEHGVPGYGGPSQRGGLRTGVLVAAIAGVGALALLGGFLMFDGSDDESQASTEPTATSTVPGTAPTATTEPAATPSPTPTLAPNTARITGLSIAGTQYEVPFETGGFVPTLPGQHVHFFFDTTPPEQAGVPGRGPWFVYGGGSPFTGYGPGDRPEGATEMCILVANPDHSVLQGTGNCFPLP